MRSSIASIVSVAVSITCFAPHFAQAASVDDAKKAYAEREFDNAGVAKAQAAADIYTELLTATADETAQIPLLIGQSEALYFVGDASADNKTKILKHDLGYKAADKASQLLGVKNVKSVPAADLAKLKALPEDQKKLLADALYNRGINLAKWGQANGAMTSLSRWPELEANMLLLEKLGVEATHDYGAYRTLGKVYAVLPKIAGGSLTKAIAYFDKAVSQTLAPNATYSRNGYNNVFYADALDKNGDTDKAKALLEAFVTADPTTLSADLVPENKRAHAEAKEMLKNL